MSTRKWVGIVVSVVLMTAVPKTWGQRGIGDNEGVVRQAIETQRITIEGTVKEVITETCENTTGAFVTGMHLFLKTGGEKQYNIHLGPAVLVKDLVGPLEAGQSIAVQAFRTEKMPAENFVAIVLTLDEKTVRLRNENLRPVWAGRQGRFFDRYVVGPERPRWSQAYGRGCSMGTGRGHGAGYGRRMGEGYGWSNGRGDGQGRGGRGQGRGLRYQYGPRICPWDAAPAYHPDYGWWN